MVLDAVMAVFVWFFSIVCFPNSKLGSRFDIRLNICVKRCQKSNLGSRFDICVFIYVYIYMCWSVSKIKTGISIWYLCRAVVLEAGTETVRPSVPTASPWNFSLSVFDWILHIVTLSLPKGEECDKTAQLSMFSIQIDIIVSMRSDCWQNLKSVIKQFSLYVGGHRRGISLCYSWWSKRYERGDWSDPKVEENYQRKRRWRDCILPPPRAVSFKEIVNRITKTVGKLWYEEHKFEIKRTPQQKILSL